MAVIPHAHGSASPAGWLSSCGFVTGGHTRDACLTEGSGLFFRHCRLSCVQSVNAGRFNGVWLIRETLSGCLLRADGPQSVGRVGERFADVSVANSAAKYGEESLYRRPSHIFNILIVSQIYSSAPSNDLIFLRRHYLRQICSVYVYNVCYVFIIDIYTSLSVAVSVT